MGKERNYAGKIATMGMLLALAMALSFIESMLPALPLLPPGVKLGLSNIVTMYCLLFLGVKPAFTVAVLKSLFVLLTRGPIASFMSVSGGLVSVLVMAIAIKFFPSLKNQYISVIGAVFHNLGQLLASVVVIGSSLTFYYLPVMLISGIVMGWVTSVLLKLVRPYLQSIRF